ncbi:hypothetical protein [Ascidiimonas sp. W6]|uniref:hypothetical protein n=1 Tax=Ascidiimonas meishanensis TaxID=3128903 RepID=UPI0030EE9FF9
MKTNIFAVLILFSISFISCQLEDSVDTIEQEQVIETNDVSDKDNTDATSRIQCFGQPTCSAGVSLGVTTSSEKDTFLIMYETPDGQPRFQYVTKGSYLNREVKYYKHPSYPGYFFKLWFKNKYVPEPGMQYEEVYDGDPISTKTYHMNWSYQY